MKEAGKEKFKILQVCSSRSWGGMEMHVVDLTRHLHNRGHDVQLLTSPGSSIFSQAVKFRLPVTTLRFGGYFQPMAVARLANFLSTHDFDLVHCHSGRDLWTIVPALKLTKPLPLILLKHIGTQKAKNDVFHRFLYREVDLMLANSHIIARNIVQTHPIPAERVKVVHLGIDSETFHPHPEWRLSARKEFKIEAGEFVIGISGRLQRWKGHYEFLHMAATLVRKHPNLRFLVIGGATIGEEEEARAIREEARRLHLEDRAIFTGYRTDVPRLLNALDLFVFPSYAEAYGLALLEAMAVGLPVIASNCDGVLDIVEHGVTGLLLPPRQTRPLIETVEGLLTNPELRKSLATAGYQRFLQRFTARKMLEELELIYRQLNRG